jgi:hypothetical protein
MLPHNKEEIINSYIAAYNSFDIDGMCSVLHEHVEFINISNGEISLTLMGLAAFKKQAQEALTFFRERRQHITSILYGDNHVEVEIDYFGVLAKDLPNGQLAGNELKLKGISVFQFHDGMITKLVDMS